jgi:hypothetical protein
MGQGVVGAAEAIHCKALELGSTDSLITIAEAMLQDEGLILECEPSQLTSLLWGDAVWGDAVWGEISCGEMPCGEMP